MLHECKATLIFQTTDPKFLSLFVSFVSFSFDFSTESFEGLIYSHNLVIVILEFILQKISSRFYLSLPQFGDVMNLEVLAVGSIRSIM